MADTTAIYGWPYQEATDPPDGAAVGQDLAEAIEATVDGLDDRIDAYDTAAADMSVSMSTTPIQPLVSAASTDTLVTSVSHAFKDGFAYEISYTFTIQMAGGAGPYAPYAKIRRTNAAGTVIDDGGSYAGVSNNFFRIHGKMIVKCTAGNTTQTIALVGGFSTSGSPTSMDVEAASTRRTRLEVRRIGTSAQYTDALEVPTA